MRKLQGERVWWRKPAQSRLLVDEYNAALEEEKKKLKSRSRSKPRSSSNASQSPVSPDLILEAPGSNNGFPLIAERDVRITGASAGLRSEIQACRTNGQKLPAGLAEVRRYPLWPVSKSEKSKLNPSPFFAAGITLGPASFGVE